MACSGWGGEWGNKSIVSDVECGVCRCLGDEQRGDEGGRTEEAAGGGDVRKEEGRRTKRTGELLMRASRLALSANARTHIHTQGAHTERGYCYTLHHPCLLLPSHHPQPQPQFSLSVLPSLYLDLSPVLCHAIPITSSTLSSTQPATESCYDLCLTSVMETPNHTKQKARNNLKNTSVESHGTQFGAC